MTPNSTPNTCILVMCRLVSQPHGHDSLPLAVISLKLGAASEVTPHLLPCKVEAGGEACSPARVEDFFTPTIREEPQTAPSSEKGEV